MRTATIYNFLIEANIIAGIAILLLIPVRAFLRKALGNRAICFAWLLVAVRLLCPLALPNPLINEIVTPFNDQPQAIRPIAAQFRVRLGDALSDAAWSTADNLMEKEGLTFNDAVRRPEYKAVSGISNGLNTGRLAKMGMGIYAAGAAGVALWFLTANIRFRRALKKGRIQGLEGDLKEYYEALCRKYGVKPLPVYFVDPLSSACLVGGLRPYIALPLAASDGQCRQMLAHELCHYKAKDHVWTLLTLVCCAAHWFDPLVWAAASMSRLDRELKCDDHVIRDMDEDGRRLYAGTLIQSVSRRAAPGMPVLATGMSMAGRKMKARVGGILWGGKRIKALAMAFVTAASMLLVCAFGTAAYGETPGLYGEEQERSYLWDGVNGQSMEEALKSENAIPTKEAAIQRAKELLGGPEWQVDVEDPKWVWTVDDTEYGVMNRINYVVRATHGKEELLVRMAVDGSGVWSITNGADPYFTEDYPFDPGFTPNAPVTEETLERVKQFCLDFTEKAEPGETQYFKEIRFNDFIVVDGAIYVQLEAVYNQDSGKTYNVLVTPEIRLIDYYTGNG